MQRKLSDTKIFFCSQVNEYLVTREQQLLRFQINHSSYNSLH